MEIARADAERIKKIGDAEAFSVELVGKAEAERMRMKAAAYKQYGDAAIMAMVLESLPSVRATPLTPSNLSSSYSFSSSVTRVTRSLFAIRVTRFPLAIGSSVEVFIRSTD